ncbi:MAG: hypothetical protein II939_13580, partial [Bacteroidales bacterium]|nr:hypothetical protein [Bacteroidales bacterium]
DTKPPRAALVSGVFRVVTVRVVFRVVSNPLNPPYLQNRLKKILKTYTKIKKISIFAISNINQLIMEELTVKIPINPSLINNVDVDLFRKKVLEYSEMLFLFMNYGGSKDHKFETNTVKMRPSKSAMEWARSLCVKGGNVVPLDEDGKGWRLEKY